MLLALSGLWGPSLLLPLPVSSDVRQKDNSPAQRAKGVAGRKVPGKVPPGRSRQDPGQVPGRSRAGPGK
eukprot:8847510-Pyramimonas_sp.AAC.1